MKKPLLLLLFPVVLVALSSAQTCVGIFNFQLFDLKTQKPVSEETEKKAWYVFTMDEGVYYDETQSVTPFDSILTNESGYTIKQDAPGYSLLKNKEPSMVTFPALCGLYLVQMEFIRKNDTMRLGIYNIPAHQSFQMDTVFFQKGNYFLNLESSRLLGEFTFVEDKGWFQIPQAMIQPFAAIKTENKE